MAFTDFSVSNLSITKKNENQMDHLIIKKLEAAALLRTSLINFLRFMQLIK